MVRIIVIPAYVHRQPNDDDQKDMRDPRRYAITCRIVCSCCEISGFTSDLSEGVLRLVISKKLITLGSTCPYILLNGSDPNDPALTSQLQHRPTVEQGPTSAYDSSHLQYGNLYVRVDMPGVSDDNFTVSVTNGTVSVSGQAPALSHDSGDRFYCGEVALLSTPINILISRIITFYEFGVFYLNIFSPL